MSDKSDPVYLHEQHRLGNRAAKTTERGRELIKKRILKRLNVALGDDDKVLLEVMGMEIALVKVEG